VLSNRPAPFTFGLAASSALLVFAIGAVLPAHPGIAYAATGAILLAAAASHARTTPAIVAYIMVILATSVLVSIPQDVRAGSISGGGLLTIALVAAPLPLLIRAPAAVGRLPRLLVIFLTWAVVATRATFSLATGESLAVLFLFAVAMAVGIIAASETPSTTEMIGKALTATSWLGLAVFAGLYAIGNIGTDQASIEAGRSPRAFALVTLLPLAWGLAGLRTKQAKPWLALAALIMIGTSLSRGAFAAAIILAAITWIDPSSVGGWFKTLLAATTAATIFFVAVSQSSALHDRVYTGQVYTYHGIAVNLEGRNTYWSATWNDWQSNTTSQLVGHGAGRSDQVVTTTTNGLVAHPHNDYLRLLDDYGIIGFTLWLLVWLGIIRQSWRAGQVPNTTPVERRIAWTAVLFSLAVGLTMLVDNAFIYAWMMGPLGLLGGMAIAIAARGRGGGLAPGA
jgi:O-antigen ligase